MPSIDKLLETAAARTGLDDFGDGAFREGLGVLLSSHADPDAFEIDLNRVGSLFARYVDSASRWTSH